MGRSLNHSTAPVARIRPIAVLKVLRLWVPLPPTARVMSVNTSKTAKRMTGTFAATSSSVMADCERSGAASAFQQPTSVP